MSRLTLDIRGKKTKFSLFFPCFEIKPVRLGEDWRSLTRNSKSVILLRPRIIVIYTIIAISTERSDERSTVYDDI